MTPLKARIEEVMLAKEWTIADVSRAAKVSHSAVSQWLGRANSTTETINSTAAANLSDASGFNATWLATGKGEKKISDDDFDRPMFMRKQESLPILLTGNLDYPAIRRVALKAQAGVTGYAVDYLNDDGPPIVFRKDWYTAHHYSPDKMLAMRVAGESMVPSLYAGDLIIINTGQTDPKDGIAFVVNYEGEIVVKRLVRDMGQWWLTSDNPDQRRHPRKACDDGTQIIGEVVYRQTERI